MQTQFNHLINQALQQDFSGWDFSWLKGRWLEKDPSWDYPQIVQQKINAATALLDMGTGGGEFLASLPTLPPTTYATEGYAPNIPVAQARLEPLGVNVIPLKDEKILPFPDSTFDLIINRHEFYHIPELHRILAPGGIFITQQVGAKDCIQINHFLEAPLSQNTETWTLENEVKHLKQAGFKILRYEEEFLDSIFYDIGAIVFYLKIISWQIPDFSIEKYHNKLLAMHQSIQKEEAFYAKSHRFLIETQKMGFRS